LSSTGRRTHPISSPSTRPPAARSIPPDAGFSSPLSRVKCAPRSRWCRSTRRSSSTRTAGGSCASRRCPSCTWISAAWPCGNECMRSFLLRRLLHALVVVWGVVTFVFFLVRLPGDPAAFLVHPTATQAEIEHTRRLLGLDRPLGVQYADFLLAIGRGDFGQSMQARRPALGMVLEHLWPATAMLAAAAIALSTGVAIPLGVLSATPLGGGGVL